VTEGVRGKKKKKKTKNNRFDCGVGIREGEGRYGEGSSHSGRKEEHGWQEGDRGQVGDHCGAGVNAGHGQEELQLFKRALSSAKKKKKGKNCLTGGEGKTALGSKLQLRLF